jgi:hypothetical protein
MPKNPAKEAPVVDGVPMDSLSVESMREALDTILTALVAAGALPDIYEALRKHVIAIPRSGGERPVNTEARIRQVVQQSRALTDRVQRLAEIVKAAHPPASAEYRYAEQSESDCWDSKSAENDLVEGSHSITPSKTIERTILGETTVERHESFGCIQANRVSGSTKLVGSAVDTHMHFIVIRIKRAQFETSKFNARSTIWPNHGIDDEIVEVAMSAAQWAEMITCMNVGLGIPCTLRYVRGRRMEDVPDTHSDPTDRILREFQEELKKAPKDAYKAQEKLLALIESAGLSGKKTAELAAAARAVAPRFEANVPFILKEFSEAAEKSVAAVKSEIDASLSLMAMNLGLERMRERGMLHDQAIPVVVAELPESTDGEPS